MTKTVEAVLQLTADLEELSGYIEESRKEADILADLRDKILEPIRNKESSKISKSEYETLIVSLKETQKKLHGIFQSEIRVITRVAPSLESFFEDTLSRFIKETNSALVALEFRIIDDTPELASKFEKHRKLERELGANLRLNVNIAQTIIKDIVKRLEDN